MSRQSDTPRDLLFGLLALQTGLIDQSALVLAFQAWTNSEGRTMADVLVEQGALESEQRFSLESLAAQQLKKHGGDTEKSLAAIAIGPSTRQKLSEVADPKLLDSLATVGIAPSTLDFPDTSAGRSIGTATSGGQRFRVLRPHAKGGLGEVFVALDAELNREVALKEIQDRHDHPASRSKFLVEAEITGGLEHPGIVPVYGLGHHEDGRPYYAMRFIKGDNLKEAIEQFHANENLKADPGARSIALRKLLRRFVDVCNAIEYAHSRGVLHRDIKPGNVIVGRHGETLVVDWGLAKARGKDGSTLDEPTLLPASASGSAETLPGHVIGTPAYMSPEQAAGDLDSLGPRSDVYSLGATLYSLLTGRVAFEGKISDVLKAVQEGRFTRPRAIDPTIDPALEAICLKAMARSTGDRYPGPRSLAEDIDRWSADEPVAAWKEPLARRARRWARRHRTSVTAASATVLALLVGLAGVLAVQSKANRDLNAKNTLLIAANAREAQANASLKLANDEVNAKNAKLVEANERESKINADLKLANEKVQARFDLAQQSIQTFRTTVTEEQILKDEQFRALRDKLLRSAADFYGKLGALLEGQPDRRSRSALARAYEELGDLTAEIGIRREALEICRKALTILRDLALENVPSELLDLAETLLFVGKLAGETGDVVGELAGYEEGRQLLERASWPQAFADRADGLLASSYNNIGRLRDRLGEPAKALVSYGRAAEIQTKLTAAHPTLHEYQANLANTHNNIGYLLEHTGEPAKALESYGRALEIDSKLALANPTVTKYQAALANIHNNIGSLLDDTGERAKALDSYGRALEIQSKLALANPAVTKYQSDLARSHNNIGLHCDRIGEPAKALESYGRALEIQSKLALANPSVTRFLTDLATTHNNIGFVLGRTGQLAKAMESYGRALEIRSKRVETNPSVTEFQSDLAISHNNIALLFESMGEPARALESHGRALEIRSKVARANPADAGFQVDLARSHNNIGVLLVKVSDPGKALDSLREALEVRRRLTETHPLITSYQFDLQESLGSVGVVLAQLGRAREAVSHFREAVSMEGRLPPGPRTLMVTANVQVRLAWSARLPGSGLTAGEAGVEADRAMTAIIRAVEAGALGRAELSRHPRYQVIRSRPDFQALLMDLGFPDRPFAP